MTARDDNPRDNANDTKQKMAGKALKIHAALCSRIAKDSGVKIEFRLTSLVHSNISRIRGRPTSRQVRNPFQRIFPTS